MAHSSSVVLLAPSRPRPFATFRRCTGVAPARPARTIHRAPRDSHILPSPRSRRPPPPFTFPFACNEQAMVGSFLARAVIDEVLAPAFLSNRTIPTPAIPSWRRPWDC